MEQRTCERRKVNSKKWWGRYRTADGCEKRVPLAADKTAAQAMLKELLRKAELEQAGLVDPYEEHRKRPLKQHVADFRSHLQNKGVTPKQVLTVINQLQCMIDANRWKLISDVSANDALNFLGRLRAAGKSAQTYNHCLKSAKQFSRWLVRDGRVATNPLSHLSRLNVSTDRRHDRRALSPDEFRRLINAANSGPTIEAIPGPDRAMMYILAAWTGFRKGEIGSLKRASLSLVSDPPTATVAACFSKRRREDSQVLHPEVVRSLKEWLATKPDLEPDAPLFPISGKVTGGTERKTHKMMQRDLETARQGWIEEASTKLERLARNESDFLIYRDNSGRFADFHSNRHLFITSLETAKLSPKMAQTLARHSDIRLTLGVYTHLDLQDQTAAIRSLPDPPGTISLQSSEANSSPAKNQSAAPETVPILVPRGAEIGAERLASKEPRFASNCIQNDEEGDESDAVPVDVSPDATCAFCTEGEQSASDCTHDENAE